ncbi:acyltransferase family protein [Sanguibacter sp. A247]|uniref:acyltransferase family protein n=1 Tax=unclassified Sanguibacter TaxID=2645534 RepID=UPI003FD82A4F
MSTRTADASARTRRGPRDPWPDNARFFAAVLIVMVHFGDQVQGESAILDHLLFVAWPARVPLYALLAGYFSHAGPFDRRHAISLLRNILFVYLCFELLATAHKWMLSGTLQFDPARPSLALWFLLSLFIWRALLPLVTHLRGVVLLSIGVALIAGFAPSIAGVGSMSRTLAFFPVFLVGAKLREHGLRHVLDRVWVRWASVAVLAVWTVAIFATEDDLKRRWFSMVKPYAESNLMGDFTARVLVLIGGGILAALAVLALMPRGRLLWITYLGSGSFYIYLIHPFAVRQLAETGLLDRLDSRTDVLLLLAATAVFATLLATPPVRRVFRPLIQPTYTWLFTPPAPQDDAQRTAAPAEVRGHVAGSAAPVSVESLENEPPRPSVASAQTTAVHVADATASTASRSTDVRES